MATPISFNQLSPLLPIYTKANKVVFLAGQPGIGKSAVVKNLAKTLHTEVFVLSVNQLGTREDLTGARAIKDEKENTYRQIFFPHAIIQDAIDYAKAHPSETPLLFLDEINRTSPDVTSAILALITERRIGTTDLPDNIRIIAAGNDEGNVNNLDDASITRMAIFHVKPDVSEFINAQPDLNYYIKKVLTANPSLLLQSKIDSDDADDTSDPDDDFENLNDLYDGDTMTQMTVPRTLTYTSDFLNSAGLDGQSLPDDLNSIYDPLNPDNSPLYYALLAQLGDTLTTSKLYDEITTSIETLLQQGATSNQKQISVPKPNQDLIQLVQYDAKSDDDIDEAFETYDEKDCLNTFFTLIQPDIYNNVKYTNAINRYYNNLLPILDGNNQFASNFTQLFAKLVQNHQIAEDVTNMITHNTGAPSKTGDGLTFIINTLN